MESSSNKENKFNLYYVSELNSPGSCGYCKNDGKKSKTSYSLGFSTKKITPEVYEKMMFLGWRRCGDYLYKPELSKSCCKLYTLRLDIERFKINKNQRRVMKNFRKFIAGIEKNISVSASDMIVEKNLDPNVTVLLNLVKNFIISNEFISLFEYKFESAESLDLKVYLNLNPKFGDYTSNTFISLYFYLVKISEKIKNEYSDKHHFFSRIFDLFNEYVKNIQLTDWRVEMSNNSGHLNFYAQGEVLKGLDSMRKLTAQSKKENFNKNKNQSSITKEEKYLLNILPELVDDPEFKISDIKHKYSIEIEPNSVFRDEKFQIYKKYQISVHKDKESELSKERFLRAWGDSNLQNGDKIENSENHPLIPSRYGTYDLIHRLDDKIFAVGVLDILPNSMSSVYLYYDPDYSFLNPGIFSAIREIELLKFFNTKISKQLKFYCMGFYCHTCPKMNYKGDYSPSELLCPFTYNWVDLNSVQKILETKIFQELTHSTIIEEMNFKENQFKEILNKLMLTKINKTLNLVDYLNDYIRPPYDEILLNCVQDFIRRVGKRNIFEFKFVMEEE